MSDDLTEQLRYAYAAHVPDPDQDDDAPFDILTSEMAEVTALLREAAEALTAERQARAQAEQERDRLREALEELRINANRLCDRQLGGTYEQDCRRSLAKAEAALSPQDGQP